MGGAQSLPSSMLDVLGGGKRVPSLEVLSSLVVFLFVDVPLSPNIIQGPQGMAPGGVEEGPWWSLTCDR